MIISRVNPLIASNTYLICIELIGENQS